MQPPAPMGPIGRDPGDAEGEGHQRGEGQEYHEPAHTRSMQRELPVALERELAQQALSQVHVAADLVGQ